DRKPGQLSGGQRQRVAMGRALARDPALFLFDEPLSNLDAKLRVEMRGEIKRMHQRTGTTIVYVTHDQIEAMTLGDRVAVMKDGVVQQFGSPRDIYDTPANLFVAGFIGSPSMNFISGKIAPSGIECGTVGLLPLAHSLTNLQGKNVILGIRPENITDEPQPNQLAHKINVTVDMVEPTGPDTLVQFKFNGATVTARVHPRRDVKPGDKIDLYADLSKALLFDEQSGERLVA
ncbi:MAG: ATP-binding cassette domain-containing protein, partial [Pseudomonadota bacterium]